MLDGVSLEFHPTPMHAGLTQAHAVPHGHHVVLHTDLAVGVGLDERVLEHAVFFEHARAEAPMMMLG